MEHNRQPLHAVGIIRQPLLLLLLLLCVCVLTQNLVALLCDALLWQGSKEHPDVVHG
jgi:hypothetical protein